MKKTASTSGFLTLVFIALFCMCTNSPVTGSGGTDFPNTKTAVVGQITNEDGSAGTSTIVHLLPHDFNPLTDTLSTIVDTTDSSGYFSLPIEESGTYNLHATHLQNGTRCMKRTIEVNNESDTVPVGVKILKLPGTMVVAVPEKSTAANGYIYLLGTQYYVPVTEGQQYVVLDSVPVGIAPSLYFIQENGEGEEPVLIQDSIEVVSGDTTLVAPEMGDDFIKVFFNTTKSGADISDDVYNFPVALRFASLSIDMKKIAANGSDLVITNSNMHPLPMQIETWDAQTNDALVWVLIDTILGNNSTQFLYLFWGNGQQKTEKSSGMVFDTVHGFSAVWHLDSGCINATGNGNDGEKGSTISDTIGILGGAQQFHGNDSIVIPGLLGRPSTITLSVWAKLDSSVEFGAEVVTLGDAILIRMDDAFNNKGCQGSFFSYPDSDDTMTHEYLGSGEFLAHSGWHYFTYIFDGNKMVHEFYLDGELCCTKQVTVPIHYDSVGTNIIIGNHGNEKVHWDFIGTIDEVRVEHIVRSASWVRLCYMNQHAEDKLIFMKP